MEQVKDAYSCPLCKVAKDLCVCEETKEDAERTQIDEIGCAALAAGNAGVAVPQEPQQEKNNG